MWSQSTWSNLNQWESASYVLLCSASKRKRDIISLCIFVRAEWWWYESWCGCSVLYMTLIFYITFIICYPPLYNAQTDPSSDEWCLFNMIWNSIAHSNPVAKQGVLCILSFSLGTINFTSISKVCIYRARIVSNFGHFLFESRLYKTKYDQFCSLGCRICLYSVRTYGLFPPPNFRTMFVANVLWATFAMQCNWAKNAAIISDILSVFETFYNCSLILLPKSNFKTESRSSKSSRTLLVTPCGKSSHLLISLKRSDREENIFHKISVELVLVFVKQHVYYERDACCTMERIIWKAWMRKMATIHRKTLHKIDTSSSREFLWKWRVYSISFIAFLFILLSFYCCWYTQQAKSGHCMSLLNDAYIQNVQSARQMFLLFRHAKHTHFQHLQLDNFQMTYD